MTVTSTKRPHQINTIPFRIPNQAVFTCLLSYLCTALRQLRVLIRYAQLTQRHHAGL